MNNASGYKIAFFAALAVIIALAAWLALDWRNAHREKSSVAAEAPASGVLPVASPAATATDIAPVAEGVKIVYDQFLKILGDHHIEPIDAVGQPFDPTFHEAVMQQPSREHPPGSVHQQLARGYMMHGRVIRPAKGIVAQ